MESKRRGSEEAPAVEVRGISKRFCRDLRRSLWYGVKDLAASVALGPSSSPDLRPGEFWAVQDVSFELEPGECLGVIGPNGAGKTTLLRMIQGRLRPDAGEIVVRGALSAISELGIGFDPVLTGRENVFTNAALLGFPRGEIEGRLDEITEFSGLGDVLDAPVLTYSAGMKARLGFAVAAHLDPDILLIDEVLAVGDVSFRRKCIQHMMRFAAGGRSLIFVSHDLYSIQVLCHRALYLEDGGTVLLGPVKEAVRAYLEAQQSRTEADGRRLVTGPVDDDVPLIIDGLEIQPVEDDVLKTGGRARVVLHYRSRADFKGVPWGFQITSGDLVLEVASGVGALEEHGQRIGKGKGTLSAEIIDFPLMPGAYALRAGVTDPHQRTVMALYGYDTPPTYFTVHPAGREYDNFQRLSGAFVALRTRPL